MFPCLSKYFQEQNHFSLRVRMISVNLASCLNFLIQDLLENEDFKLEEIFVLSLVRDVATVMH